jgi:hypothetical protein
MAESGTPKRFFTVFTFAGLGPALGALGVLAFFFAMMLTDASTSAMQAASLSLGASVMFLIFGYWFGVVPALLTGLFYAFAPTSLQRIVLSPLYGAASVWIVDKVADLATGGAWGGGDLTMMMLAGAASAPFCAYLVRLWGFTPVRTAA